MSTSNASSSSSSDTISAQEAKAFEAYGMPHNSILTDCERVHIEAVKAGANDDKTQYEIGNALTLFCNSGGRDLNSAVEDIKDRIKKDGEYTVMGVILTGILKTFEVFGGFEDLFHDVYDMTYQPRRDYIERRKVKLEDSSIDGMHFRPGSSWNNLDVSGLLDSTTPTSST